MKDGTPPGVDVGMTPGMNEGFSTALNATPDGVETETMMELGSAGAGTGMAGVLDGDDGGGAAREVAID